jgi:hypothetical protein
MIESVPIAAVPVSVIAHEGKPGPVALPFALHSIVVGDLRAPSAVPVNFRSPGQLALNDPFADDAVCSVTFHLKSVQVLGVGMRVEDVQLPSSELLPAAEGSVSELLCSRLVQPAVTTPAASSMTRKVFFISVTNRRGSGAVLRKTADLSRVVIGRTNPTEQGQRSDNYTISSFRDLSGFARRARLFDFDFDNRRRFRNQRMGWIVPV